MEKENDFSLEMNEVNVDDVEELEAAVALGGLGIIPGSSRGCLYGFVNHRDTSPAAIARAVVGHDALDGCAERAEEGGATYREGRAGVAEQPRRSRFARCLSSISCGP